MEYEVDGRQVSRSEVEKMQDEVGGPRFEFMDRSPGYFREIKTRAILKPMNLPTSAPRSFVFGLPKRSLDPVHAAGSGLGSREHN